MVSAGHRDPEKYHGARHDRSRPQATVLLCRRACASGRRAAGRPGESMPTPRVALWHLSPSVDLRSIAYICGHVRPASGEGMEMPKGSKSAAGRQLPGRRVPAPPVTRGEGISGWLYISPDKQTRLVSWPDPVDRKDVQRLLGFCNYLRAWVAAPHGGDLRARCLHVDTGYGGGETHAPQGAELTPSPARALTSWALYAGHRRVRRRHRRSPLPKRRAGMVLLQVTEQGATQILGTRP
jgi:hypothetical protein